VWGVLEQEGSGTRLGAGLVGTFGAERTGMGPLELVVWRGGACLTFHVDVNHLLISTASVELLKRVIDADHFATRGEGGRNVRCWQDGPGRLRRHGSPSFVTHPNLPAFEDLDQGEFDPFLPPSWRLQDSFLFLTGPPLRPLLR
jgi:hypothetical protein